MVYFLVLYEDLYESSHGDGKFHYPEEIFFDLDSAKGFKDFRYDNGYAYHIRPGLIFLDGDKIECNFARRMFDDVSRGEILSMVTKKLEMPDLGPCTAEDSLF